MVMKFSFSYSFFSFQPPQKFEIPDFSFFATITFVIRLFFRFSLALRS